MSIFSVESAGNSYSGDKLQQKLKQLGIEINEYTPEYSLEELDKIKGFRDANEHKKYLVELICDHKITAENEQVGRFKVRSGENDMNLSEMSKSQMLHHMGTLSEAHAQRKETSIKLSNRSIKLTLIIDKFIIGKFNVVEFCDTIIEHYGKRHQKSRFNPTNEKKHNEKFIKLLEGQTEKNKDINRKLNLLDTIEEYIYLGSVEDYHYKLNIKSSKPDKPTKQAKPAKQSGGKTHIKSKQIKRNKKSNKSKKITKNKKSKKITNNKKKKKSKKNKK